MAAHTIAAYDATTDSSNIQLLVAGTPTDDVLTNGVTCATSDTFTIDANFNDNLIVVIYAYNSGNSAVTFDAGDNPPSPHAGLGSKVVTVTNAECWLFVPEKGRHIQSDGTITGSVATTACKIWVFRNGPGYLGVNPSNASTIPAAPTD